MESSSEDDRGPLQRGVALYRDTESQVTEIEIQAVQRGAPADSHPLLVPVDSDVRPTISFVLPTLNEADGIGPCIDAVLDSLEELEVLAEIIVSDSSTDGTGDIARERGAIVVHPEEKGYGAAYRHAFEQARGRYVVMGDADMTYDFRELPKLYRHVAEGDADIALGSRLNGEIKPGAMPALHQYIGNPLLTAFLNIFYEAGVSDAHSGFRVIDADALREMHLHTNGMEFASEMIMVAGATGLTIAEEPITYHPRVGEAKLESFSDGWRHVRFMLENAPGYLFTIPGLGLGAFGVLLMLISFGDVGIAGLNFGIHPMIAGSLLTIVGYQILSMGVFASKAGNPIRASKDPFTDRLITRVKLEHAATIGLLVFIAGLVYAGFIVMRWAGSGYNGVPLVAMDVFAFTAIVLGLSMIFNAFCLSAIQR